MKYRKKTDPVVAIQWTGENTAEVEAFLAEHCGPHRDVSVEPQLIIRSGQTVTVKAGEYVIVDPRYGHTGSMRAADFKVTYEEVP